MWVLCLLVSTPQGVGSLVLAPPWARAPMPSVTLESKFLPGDQAMAVWHTTATLPSPAEATLGVLQLPQLPSRPQVRQVPGRAPDTWFWGKYS